MPYKDLNKAREYNRIRREKNRVKKYCIKCNKELPKKRWKYCSDRCKYFSKIDYYYKNRNKKIEYQKIWDKNNKDKKNSYDIKRRLKRQKIDRIRYYDKKNYKEGYGSEELNNFKKIIDKLSGDKLNAKN